MEFLEVYFNAHSFFLHVFIISIFQPCFYPTKSPLMTNKFSLSLFHQLFLSHSLVVFLKSGLLSPIFPPFSISKTALQNTVWRWPLYRNKTNIFISKRKDMCNFKGKRNYQSRRFYRISNVCQVEWIKTKTFHICTGVCL